ncbi:hypothetical protein GCM10010909_14860 [Acidocella aquatica]|uniref:Glycine-zipper-containing OmpA-like membrane domain-containing protein n=2 Tax=Acidocella aquatica TaxID=1922313 RepID=A0ABQ6A4N9_9PROT|nr:hypothetical protein GCM10010909_14860 [Acidocella aquatica]
MSPTRKIANFGLALLPVIALGACTVAPPTGPSVVAMPGEGKSFPQFQQDDYNCRGYAQSRMGNPGQDAANAQNNSTATAVAGTLIGAAAGAALGSLSGNVGAGAAIGAGAGLLGGSSVAGNNTQAAADSLQRRYDIAYAQCMVGNGETIQGDPAPSPYGYAAPPPPPGYYPGPGPY